MRDTAIMRVATTSTSSSESIEPLGGCAGVAGRGGVGVTIACTGVPGGCIVVGVRTTKVGGAVAVGVVALTLVIACVTPTPTVVALAGLVALPTTPVGSTVVTSVSVA
jgi:hypothetical protein